MEDEPHEGGWGARARGERERTDLECENEGHGDRAKVDGGEGQSGSGDEMLSVCDWAEQDGPGRQEEGRAHRPSAKVASVSVMIASRSLEDLT